MVSRTQKAKQFDDGLYAAIELAAQHGAGSFAGKKALLDAVAHALADATPDVATQTVEAATRLGGGTIALPPRMEEAVAATIAGFDQDALVSKPIGFYTWSPELTAVFRQDRMLQRELKGSGIAVIVTALHQNPNLRATYESYLDLTARLTNPPAAPDLRPLLALPDGAPAVRGKVHFFPPSRAHETDLIKRLFGDKATAHARS